MRDGVSVSQHIIDRREGRRNKGAILIGTLALPYSYGDAGRRLWVFGDELQVFRMKDDNFVCLALMDWEKDEIFKVYFWLISNTHAQEKICL